jgi:hypothetical protein
LRHQQKKLFLIGSNSSSFLRKKEIKNAKIIRRKSNQSEITTGQSAALKDSKLLINQIALPVR